MCEIGTYFALIELERNEEMSREQQRTARRWARERIVEAINGLMMTDWPFDDPEFSNFTEKERSIRNTALNYILSSISKPENGKSDELA